MLVSIKDFGWTDRSVDKLGRVFYDEEYYYRGVYNQKSTLRRVNRMFQEGLIDELVTNKIMLPIEIADISFGDIDEFGMILKSRRIKNITFPTEWSFSMLFDVAKLMLEMEKILLKHGYALFDFHPSNIIFDGTKPYFVDLGSINRENERSRQIFLQEMEKIYYRPLYLWSKKGKRITSLYSVNAGIDDKEWDTYMYGVFFGHRLSKGKELFKINRKTSFGLLEKKLNHLTNFKRELEVGHQLDWSSYQEVYFDENGRIKSNERFEIVSGLLKKYGVQAITELAANQGAFSQMCIEQKVIAYSLAIDYDEWAIDKMYHRLKKMKDTLAINLGVVDIVQPQSIDYIKSKERMKNEAVVAMALTHHLILSQGLSMEKSLDIILGYSEKYVFVEFMPLGLYSGKKSESLRGLPKTYTIENFRKIFEEKCILKEELQVSKNRVLFVGEKK